MRLHYPNAGLISFEDIGADGRPSPESLAQGDGEIELFGQPVLVPLQALILG